MTVGIMEGDNGVHLHHRILGTSARNSNDLMIGFTATILFRLPSKMAFISNQYSNGSWVKMNFLYIDCIIQERRREEREECEKRRLLNWNGWMNPRLKAQRNNDVSTTELRTRIVQTASNIFQTKGFDNTKVLDVCNSLGISRLQFYRHFRSLDAILEILWDR